MAGAAFAGSRAWAADDPWATLYPQILKRIQPPKFPNRDFDVTRYGAKPDGKTDCTAAFRKAIEEANRAGRRARGGQRGRLPDRRRFTSRAM